MTCDNDTTQYGAFVERTTASDVITTSSIDTDLLNSCLTTSPSSPKSKPKPSKTENEKEDPMNHLLECISNLGSSNILDTCLPVDPKKELPRSSVAGRIWPDKNEAVIAGPYYYLVRNPGKGVRGQVMNAFNVWMNVPEERLKIIANSIDMLHSASLLIDDIQDNSTLRRGLPVAHSIYGVGQTINSANYYYFRAMKELQKLENTEAMIYFSDELLQLHRGQGMDLHWRDSLSCPTEHEYLEMISNKTGGLFRLCIKLMQTQSCRTTSPNFLALADVLGLLFQIRDDYQNICSEECRKSKGYCDDITEGKFSFPVIHSVHCDPLNLELLNILRQRPTRPEIKQYAIQYMDRTGSLDYTRKFIDKLIAQARQLVDLISNSQQNGAFMHAVLDKLVI